jgi:Tfp pilus assembly protein PilF
MHICVPKKNMIMMKKYLVAMLVLLIAFINANAQSAYEKGWQQLNAGKVDESIVLFKESVKESANKNNALLMLTLLHSQNQQDDKAHKYFLEYFNSAEDPYATLYAIWKEGGVFGMDAKKNKEEIALLKRLAADERNKSKLLGGTNYALLANELFSFNKSGSEPYASEINSIADWSFLGPFDNVMNSGFNKDFGAVKYFKKDHQFASRYNAPIQWFDPVLASEDSYVFKNAYFLSSNSITYAQTFIKSETAKEVILNFGYSGTMKFWLNDSLLYSESELRETEMDYYRFKVKLNKGNNRVLIQLGDYEESFANFNVRLTDLNYNPITANVQVLANDYTKGLAKAENIPFFAIEQLKQKVAENESDVLAKLLLAMAHMRAKEINDAEAILLALKSEYPNNILVVRTMIFLYKKAGDNTNQNKHYELFKQAFPNHVDVLTNDIDDYDDADNKTKVNELIAICTELYPDDYRSLMYDIIQAKYQDNTLLLLNLLNKAYDKYPNDYDVVISQYRLQLNYYKNPKKAEKVLLAYLEDNYQYDMIKEVANNYIEVGNAKKAIALLNKSLEIATYDIDTRREIVSTLSRNGDYDDAITMCTNILKSRPADYYVLEDKAALFNIVGKVDSAIAYYELALMHFPFSFEINEKLRELNSKSTMMDEVPTIEPEEIIASYNTGFKASQKKSYDIVYENHNVIIYESKAVGEVYRYILKMNDDKAIEKWQEVTLSPSSIKSMYLNEAKTIKANGEKLDAERNGATLVFTNLEVGDYIYVSYNEKQNSGGKSSFFISNRFSLDSYYPVYKRVFNLYLANGLAIKDTVLNSSIKPKLTQLDGFMHYEWAVTNPDMVKEESYVTAFSDVGQRLHVALDYTWNDIVQWYSDLSSQQATIDLTIENIVSELFDPALTYTDDQKARIVYDFIGENIVYSSIDFRQGSYIPQLASKVYHSRLGDCKDVSTLFVTLARAVGLKANLVLINTTANGYNSVILPSLNFNHCIVKVYYDGSSKFLELTNPNLPYGYLSSSHYKAAVLEIPFGNIPDNVQLERLTWNENITSGVYRNATVKIEPQGKLLINKDVVKTGERASRACSSYYYDDEVEQREGMQKAIAGDYKTSVSLNELTFKKMEPREDTAWYQYDFEVENDVLKLGSYRTLKIPFSDKLIGLNIFQEGERQHDFDYTYYEPVDEYSENMAITIAGEGTFKEVPENVNLSYRGSTYQLTFELTNKQTLLVKRAFIVNRDKIESTEFGDFKAFMLKVNDAENTHVLFN